MHTFHTIDVAYKALSLFQSTFEAATHFKIIEEVFRSEHEGLTGGAADTGGAGGLRGNTRW